MDPIIVFEGPDLTDLHDYLSRVVAGIETGDVYRVRVAVDEGFKVKINERTWTAPLGRLEP